MRPLNGRLLVEPIEPRASDVLVLPDTASQQQLYGRIVDVASDCPSELRKGRVIAWQPYSLTEAKVDGKPIYLVDHSSVICLFDEVTA